MATRPFDKVNHAAVSVAIICMIPDTELRAIVETLLAARATEIHIDASYNAARYFELETAARLKLRLVVACCDGQSNIEAAITTQVILFRHSPRYAFLYGIAGGLRVDKCGLGDVVIDSEVVYRRFTKIGEDGNMMPEMLNVPVSDGGRALANRFFANHAHPEAIQSSLNRGRLYAAHDEKILSWDYVLDHEPTKKALLTNIDRQLSAVEMEGAGFFKAVSSYRKNLIGRPWRPDQAGGADALVVRGISDPAAGKAGSDAGGVNYREIAARNAAQTVLLLLDQLTERDFA